MRFVLGAMAVASAVPTAGMRACAGPSEGRVVVQQSLSGAVRVGCFADEAAASDVDPLGDTVPLALDGAVAFEGPCTLYGFRQDGALWGRSEAVNYPAGGGEVLLRFDHARVGGVGISFVQDPWRHEIVVKSVEPGAPADGVLSRGDRILTVDGEVVRGGRWGFSDAVTGAPGTIVELTVLTQDGERSFALERSVIPSREGNGR
jgi:hypothetical protein